ncbi:MAG: hypothetical protein COA82_00430 [Alkaliphilus sp.]|nr:MAG: hypothetical protein COA82_00430 [Alkaliphilus sp.]
MGVSSKGKKPLANKYVMLVIVLMIFSVLYSLYNELRMERVVIFVGENTESIERRITRKVEDFSDIFMNNPQNYVAETKKPTRGQGAFFTSLDEVQSTYTSLSYHNSWLLNRILIIIMSRGQVYMVFVGILLATAVYTNKESLNSDKYKPAKSIIKKQMYKILAIIMCILIVGLVLGLILGNVMYSASLNETEQIKYLNNLFIEKNIWNPDLIYTAISILGGMIYLFTYAVWGIIYWSYIKR